MHQRLVLILGLTAVSSSVLVAGPVPAAEPPSTPKTASTAPSKETDAPQKELFAGKVVLLQDALARRGVKAFDEMKGQVVLETETGELTPIVSDWRGRAFFQDQRLRNRRVELAGYRPRETPYLKVLMIFTFDERGVRQYTDYWCDLCAIPSYEIKPCDCCQGASRLRFQPRDLPDYVTAPGKSHDSPLAGPVPATGRSR